MSETERVRQRQAWVVVFPFAAWKPRAKKPRVNMRFKRLFLYNVSDPRRIGLSGFNGGRRVSYVVCGGPDTSKHAHA